VSLFNHGIGQRLRRLGRRLPDPRTRHCKAKGRDRRPVGRRRLAQAKGGSHYAYAATLTKDRLYLQAGYRVFVIWEHEFYECERAKCPRNVTEVCREFLGEHS
jgi:hypothetical protein